jgi:TonB family protein
VHGEVAMDLTLNDDGTVKEVKIIEGNPLLDNAATDAVKQWKYIPRSVHGQLIDRVVVVLMFDKNGKVRSVPRSKPTTGSNGPCMRSKFCMPSVRV